MMTRLAILFAIVALTHTRVQALTAIARADYQNVSGDGAVNQNNPGVIISIQGSITPNAGAPTDGAIKLPEASFGQPFSPFQPRLGGTGQPTYAAEVVAAARSALY